MTPHQQILAFELRRAGLHTYAIGRELHCDERELSQTFNASKPITVEVPRYMTPVFIRQCVLTIMRKYRPENDAND